MKENNMLPLAGMLFNVVAGLVVDKAQDLAEEHVEKMLDDILPDNAKKELDKIVKNDPSHTFENAKDALKGAVEGKLPVQMKDGKFMPIEMNVTLKFDPNTQKLEILNRE
tara:strand:+ start:13 stop:342 length:330 start_codon:yes stop_codon:yes gene_type:complete